jgi:glycosyltransferase involved in cell wall biosynthesis
MPTIFISIDWFHPAYKAGGPVQSVANLVNNYGDERVNFKIFCSNADRDGSIHQGIVFDEWVYYNDRTQVWYASRNSLSAIRRSINSSGAAVLFVIGIYSWYFNLLPLLVGKVPVKLISVRGMLHAGALSQKSWKKKIYLFAWKLAGIHRRYAFHATDLAEKTFIQQVFGEQPTVFVAGNFPRVFEFQPARHKKPGSLQLVSIALISQMKNIALVLGALQHCVCQIHYDIYGPVKDAAYWQECLKKIAMLPSNITVTYKMDLVPAKVAETLQAYEVMILPSKSENFGHAIIEALSAGKPVITSHNTPFNELAENWAGKNVSVEELGEMTAAIDFFAAMPVDEFAKWNRGASEYAAGRMDLDALKVQYDGMFLGKAEGGRRKAEGLRLKA